MPLVQSLEAPETAMRQGSRSPARPTSPAVGFGQAGSAPLQRILRLQRAVGNQQVARWVRDGRLTSEGQLLRTAPRGAIQRLAAPLSSNPRPRPNITPLSQGALQRSWLDDAAAIAGEAYDATAGAVQSGYQEASGAVSSTYQSASSAASTAYQDVKSTVSGVASKGEAIIAEGVKAATDTVSAAGAGISSAVSAAADTLSPDPEQTRTKLVGQVNATRQRVQAAGPDGVQADPSRVASLNQQLSGLKGQATAAAVPFDPTFIPEIGSIGEAIAETLAAIALFVAGLPVWVIVLIVVIVLAILALIAYLLLRDTRKYPEPETDPKADPKTAPKTDPQPEQKPGDGPGPVDPPWPDVRPKSICETETPTGEVTTWVGWGTTPEDATLGRWRQQLLPLNIDFSGCEVVEADPGGGKDSCYFQYSTILRYNKVSGGEWTVEPGNYWGEDFVGWHEYAVKFYRDEGKSPCSSTYDQSMRIKRPSGSEQEYTRNKLSAEIRDDTVTSSRAGQTEVRTWP